MNTARDDAERVPPNAPRYRGAPGHVESYFWRANDPRRPRAIWLKATILAPLSGPAVAERWMIYFDGDTNTHVAKKDTLPFDRARFAEDALELDGLVFAMGERGGIRGQIGGAELSLRFTRPSHPVAAPLSILPWRVLREGPFPKSKLLTPSPWLELDGEIELGGERISVAGWRGMQGHNWGKEHAFEYAWGQCLFGGEGGEPPAMLEGFTGRVRVAGRLTPRMSALIVRRGREEYRFDRLLDYWRQDAELTRDGWTLALSGAGGEARLSMSAAGRPIVCLGYANPSGERRYCMNSKLARVVCAVQPRVGPAFELVSEHGGALEFLRGEPDPRAGEVV